MDTSSIMVVITIKTIFFPHIEKNIEGKFKLYKYLKHYIIIYL
jgi:hypothetical protein